METIDTKHFKCPFPESSSSRSSNAVHLDEESKVIEALNKEILELRAQGIKENEVLKKIQDENKELLKRVKDQDEEIKKTVQDNEELRKRVQADVNTKVPNFKKKSIQNPSTSTQKSSSHSLTQNKKRKLLSSDDDTISGFGEDISKVVSMIVEKIIEDGLGACYKKLGTLEEGVLKMTKLMMEKSKEVDAGFRKLETLGEDLSKLTKLMMEKNKDVVGFKKLETLEESVSIMTRMMMEKNKEDDMGACIEKLDQMGWGAAEPIYDTALLLFLKGADYRKLWLHLKPECCGKWVKIAGSIFGLLD